MIDKMYTACALLLARSRFQTLNMLLFRLSLAGFGILNHKSPRISGETSFLENYLSKNSGVLIDVGANQGNYLLQAVKIRPDLNVFAFEPHPVTFTALRKNTASCKNVTLIHKGVSSESGVMKLFDYTGKNGSSHASLYRNVITEIHGAGAVVSHDVEMTTLDEFLDSENIHEVNLLKIDTEGNELKVLQGGMNAITNRKIKAIHFEFNEMNVHSRAFFRDFWNLLDGYRFYRLLPNEMLEIRTYHPLYCEVFAYQNIVALLKE